MRLLIDFYPLQMPRSIKLMLKGFPHSYCGTLQYLFTAEGTGVCADGVGTTYGQGNVNAGGSGYGDYGFSYGASDGYGQYDRYFRGVLYSATLHTPWGLGKDGVITDRDWLGLSDFKRLSLKLWRDPEWDPSGQRMLIRL